MHLTQRAVQATQEIYHGTTVMWKNTIRFFLHGTSGAQGQNLEASAMLRQTQCGPYPPLHKQTAKQGSYSKARLQRSPFMSRDLIPTHHYNLCKGARGGIL